MMNPTITICRIDAGHSLHSVVHLSYTDGHVGNFTFDPVLSSFLVIFMLVAGTFFC